jgi:hypothetical protein
MKVGERTRRCDARARAQPGWLAWLSQLSHFQFWGIDARHVRQQTDWFHTRRRSTARPPQLTGSLPPACPLAPLPSPATPPPPPPTLPPSSRLRASTRRPTR